jgi:hypothetical protein
MRHNYQKQPQRRGVRREFLASFASLRLYQGRVAWVESLSPFYAEAADLPSIVLWLVRSLLYYRYATI